MAVNFCICRRCALLTTHAYLYRNSQLYGRYHLGARRGEDDIDAFNFALREIAAEIAGIRVEILVRTELQRVDEDRDDDEVGLGAGSAHQQPVTVVSD